MLMVLMVIVAVTTLPVIVQADFATGLMFGYAAGSSNGGEFYDGGATVLYVMPRASERVNIMDVRLTAGRGEFNSRHSGLTIRQIFEKWLPSSSKKDDFEIIQIVRVFDGKDPYYATIWFAYAEKRLIIPLEKLPPLISHSSK